MAGTTGLEPATSAVTGQRSNQLSYVPRRSLKNDAWTPKKKTPNNSIATTELSLSEDKAPGVHALSRICSLVSPQLNEKGEGDFPSLVQRPWWDLWRAHLADAAMPAVSEDHRFATAFNAARLIVIA